MGQADPKLALERHVSNLVDLSVQNAPKPSQARGTDLECFRRVHVLQMNTSRHWMRELRSLLLSAIKALQAALTEHNLLTPECEKTLELVGRVNGSLGVMSILDWTPDLDCALPVLKVSSSEEEEESLDTFSASCERAYRQLRHASNVIRSLNLVDEKAGIRVANAMHLLLVGTRETNRIISHFLAKTDMIHSDLEATRKKAFNAYVSMVCQDIDRIDAQIAGMSG